MSTEERSVVLYSRKNTSVMLYSDKQKADQQVWGAFWKKGEASQLSDEDGQKLAVLKMLIVLAAVEDSRQKLFVLRMLFVLSEIGFRIVMGMNAPIGIAIMVQRMYFSSDDFLLISSLDHYGIDPVSLVLTVGTSLVSDCSDSDLPDLSSPPSSPQRR